MAEWEKPLTEKGDQRSQCVEVGNTEKGNEKPLSVGEVFWVQVRPPGEVGLHKQLSIIIPNYTKS